jgi:hypothetical protein
MVSSNGPNSVTWYGVNTTTTDGNQPTYSIYLTNWTLVNGKDNPYYQWYFDTTWFTNNSTYYNNLYNNNSSGTAIITFINTSGQNLPESSVQFATANDYNTPDILALQSTYNNYIMSNNTTYEYQPFLMNCSASDVCAIFPNFI